MRMSLMKVPLSVRSRITNDLPLGEFQGERGDDGLSHDVGGALATDDEGVGDHHCLVCPDSTSSLLWLKRR